MKNKVSIVVSALLAALMVSPAIGGGRKKKAASPKPKYQPPEITNVMPNAVTVTDQNGTRTFIVTQFTEINVNGQRATLADLKPGMTATVTIGTDPTHASRIKAEGVPADGSRKKK
jgi:hypothetical protein